MIQIPQKESMSSLSFTSESATEQINRTGTCSPSALNLFSCTFSQLATSSCLSLGSQTSFVPAWVWSHVTYLSMMYAYKYYCPDPPDTVNYYYIIVRMTGNYRFFFFFPSDSRILYLPKKKIHALALRNKSWEFISLMHLCKKQLGWQGPRF